MYTCRSVQIKFCYQNNLTHTQTMYYLIGPRKSCKFTFLRNVPHEIGLSFSNLCFPLLFLCSPNSLKKFSISDICSSLFFIPSLLNPVSSVYSVLCLIPIEQRGIIILWVKIRNLNLIYLFSHVACGILVPRPGIERGLLQ